MSALCLPILTERQVNRAHSLLLQYCRAFESLYGAECCTPNMHMACHMRDCMLDYGPLSSFWCFSFERYNGTLEGVKKSWNGPEKQMLTKFMDMQYMCTLQKSIATGNKEDFVTLVCKNNHLFSNHLSSYGSLHELVLHDVIISNQLRSFNCSTCLLDAEEKPYQSLVQPLKEKYFSDAELSNLRQMYAFLYPNCTIESLSHLYYHSKQLIMNNEVFISTGSRSQSSAAIAAHWQGVTGIDPHGEAPMRIGVVSQFIHHEISCIKDSESPSSSTVAHVLADVKWYMDHPRRDYFHSSIIVCHCFQC